MQVLLAHYVGFKPPEESDTDTDGESESGEMDEESVQQLASVFGLPLRGSA